MKTVVEVVGWEHECCGPAYERDAVVELTYVCLSEDENVPARAVETHHDMYGEGLVALRGRVVNIVIQHPDGSKEQDERLPGGRALGGMDEHDDGHLEQPWTSEPVL